MTMELVVSVATAAIAIVVFIVGDRLRPQAWRHSDEHAAGSLVRDLISTFFLAVVAFVVVICWQQYDNAHSHTVTEANALTNTYWAARGLPDPERGKVEHLVRDYTSRVVDQEWQVMDREHRLSRPAQDTLDTLRDTVAAVHSEDPTVSDRRASALTSLDQVAEARHDRAIDAEYGMPGFLYAALWFGTILLLISPVLTGIRVTKRSVAMIALLGVLVGSATFQIYQLDHPFSGGDVVGKDAFRLALSDFQQSNERDSSVAR